MRCTPHIFCWRANVVIFCQGKGGTVPVQLHGQLASGTRRGGLFGVSLNIWRQQNGLVGPICHESRGILFIGLAVKHKIRSADAADAVSFWIYLWVRRHGSKWNVFSFLRIIVDGLAQFDVL